MEAAYLRLAAVRTEGVGPEREITDLIGSCRSRSGAYELALDHRATSLRSAAGQCAALLGYALLPWCDVTLWSVARAASGPGEVKVHAGCTTTFVAAAPSCASLDLDLARIDEALAYVERLPVERSLVAKAWRWRWSSAAWHCGFGSKPVCLAPEWSGPARRDLWRERLAGTFIGRGDRSVPWRGHDRNGPLLPSALEESWVDRLTRRTDDHSPGMPSGASGTADAMDPSHGELAVA
jgi:hypothetical protein